MEETKNNLPLEDESGESEAAEGGEKRERYESRQGFVLAGVRRGFTEIRPVYELIAKYEGKAFICGGYVRFMCSPRKKVAPAGDVDIYCHDEETFNALRAEFEKELEVRKDTDVAVTYKVPENGTYQYCPTIQLVKSLDQGAIVATGEMEKILDSFDFTIIRGGLVSDTQAMVDADFNHDELKGMLRLKNIHCPISSMLRCMKYARKGYYMTPVEAVKLFADWQGRDDEYRTKIVDGVERIEKGEELSREDIEELERLMKID